MGSCSSIPGVEVYAFEDEAELLDKAEDVDETYVQQVLPGKMAYNLASIRRFGLGQELLTMLRTVKAVL